MKIIEAPENPTIPEIIEYHRQLILQVRICLRDLRKALSSLQECCFDAWEKKPEGAPDFFDELRTGQQRLGEYGDTLTELAYILAVETSVHAYPDDNPPKVSVLARTYQSLQDLGTSAEHLTAHIDSVVQRFNA